MIYSRPVTYVAWTSKATDGKKHEVVLSLQASAEIAVNLPSEKVIHDRQDTGNLAVLKVGSKDQVVLGMRGDDLRINWGQFYIAAPKSEGIETAGFTETNSQEGLGQGQVPAEQAQNTNAFFEFKPFQVGAQTVERWLMLAYDDEYSIRYFGKNLQPYWRRNGDAAAGPAEGAERTGHHLARVDGDGAGEVVAGGQRQRSSAILGEAGRAGDIARAAQGIGGGIVAENHLAR